MRNILLLIVALLALPVANLKAQMQGRLLWTFDSGLNETTSEPAMSKDGTVYFGVGVSGANGHGRLFAINPDGTKKWEFDTQGAPNIPSIASDSTIYVGTKLGLLLAVNPDGSKKWEFKSDLTASYIAIPTIVSCPAIAVDGTLYFAANGTDNGSHPKSRFYALNPDGTERWRCNLNTSMIAAPPVIGRDGTVYVLTAGIYVQPALVAFTPDGRRLWSLPVAGSVLSIGQDDIIYAGSICSVTAVHPDGIILWEYPSDTFTPLHTFSLTGDIYLLGSHTCLVGSDGYLVWPSTSSAGSLLYYDGESHAPLIGLDGTMYFGRNDVSSYVVSLTVISPNGSTKWYPSTSLACNISPVMNSQGVIYVTSTTGKLFAYQGFGGPANTAWPMFQRDAQHTGRAYDIPSVPPWLTYIRSSVDRGFLYTLTGEPNKSYTIQTSTNFLDWTTATNVVLGDNPTIHFMDKTATNFNSFYRAKLN